MVGLKLLEDKEIINLFEEDEREGEIESPDLHLKELK